MKLMRRKGMGIRMEQKLLRRKETETGKSPEGEENCREGRSC